MTRKDYQIIAKLVSEISTPHWHRGAIARDFADRLQKEYKNFDRFRFLEACKPDWVVGTVHEKYYR